MPARRTGWTSFLGSVADLHGFQVNVSVRSARHFQRKPLREQLNLSAPQSRDGQGTEQIRRGLVAREQDPSPEPAVARREIVLPIIQVPDILQ